MSLETEGGRWRDLDLCLLAAGGLSESLLVLVCPMGCADWWVRCIRCLPGLLVKEGGGDVGDCSPDAWSSMNRPRLPCGLLLTVFAAGDRLLASCWRGRSWLLGPAEAPVDRKVQVSTPQHAAELSAQKVFALLVRPERRSAGTMFKTKHQCMGTATSTNSSQAQLAHADCKTVWMLNVIVCT